MNSAEASAIAEFCAAFLAERKARDLVHDGDSEWSSMDQVPTRPYPGLRSFTRYEASLFFGRRREAQELRRRLAASNVVVVLGGSGSGKSSLAIAGVLPRRNDTGRIAGKTGRWYVATFRPGAAPCDNLVEALWNDVCAPLLKLSGGPTAFALVARSGCDKPRCGRHERSRGPREDRGDPQARRLADDRDGVARFLETIDAIDDKLCKLRRTFRAGTINLLLLIDQFEENFRFLGTGQKQADIGTIVQLLESTRTKKQDKLSIVVTMRSEELHRCTEIDGLAPIVNDGFYLIDRPEISALIEASVNPGRTTLMDWDIPVTDDASEEARRLIEDGKHAPFALKFLEGLQDWVKAFQGRASAQNGTLGIHRRHQADLLPLLQHLLRITWGAAVERWHGEQGGPRDGRAQRHRGLDRKAKEARPGAARLVARRGRTPAARPQRRSPERAGGMLRHGLCDHDQRSDRRAEPGRKCRSGRPRRPR